MYIARDDMIFGKEVLGERVGEGSNHIGVQDEGCGAGNESEDADASLIDLQLCQLLGFASQIAPLADLPGLFSRSPLATRIPSSAICL